MRDVVKFFRIQETIVIHVERLPQLITDDDGARRWEAGSFLDERHELWPRYVSTLIQIRVSKLVHGRRRTRRRRRTRWRRARRRRRRENALDPVDVGESVTILFDGYVRVKWIGHPLVAREHTEAVQKVLDSTLLIHHDLHGVSRRESRNVLFD